MNVSNLALYLTRLFLLFSRPGRDVAIDYESLAIQPSLFHRRSASSRLFLSLRYIHPRLAMICTPNTLTVATYSLLGSNVGNYLMSEFGGELNLGAK